MGNIGIGAFGKGFKMSGVVALVIVSLAVLGSVTLAEKLQK